MKAALALGRGPCLSLYEIENAFHFHQCTLLALLGL
jgi:hypothetical protein